jgi:signal transduction histidine kinase
MLKKVLPVVTVVLQLEYKMKVDTTLKEFAQKTSEKAEKLAKALDVVRYNLQQSLNQQEKANKEIRELMKKKDEFMNMASHELKTPLSSIKAYLQIITRHHPEIKQNVLLSSLVEKTSKQTDRMVQLVNDLLDVNKIQSGQLKLTKTAFNINDLIYDCIEHELIQKNSHQIITTGEKNIILYADKTRMEQVITNLISNALKYSPGADKIIIYTGIGENNWFTFHVTDFGIGIPEAAFPYVFDRFFRVSSTAHKFSGLGLGLYISAEIIQRHNGQIGLQSKEGEGSTFWIKLPINGE